MRSVEEAFSFDPVYFVKAGDTLERAAKSLLGYGAGSSDVEMVMSELTRLNPRLNKPSYRRMGRLLIPGQILSLTPHDFIDEKREWAGNSDRLIQYQSAREEGLLDMDPFIREQFEQHSTENDPGWMNYFERLTYLSAETVMHDLPEFLGPVALFSGHHIGHATHAGKYTSLVRELRSLLDQAAKDARVGDLDAAGLRQKSRVILRQMAHTRTAGLDDAIGRSRGMARQTMKSTLRLNRTIISGKVPRKGRLYTNSAEAFKPLRIAKWIHGVAVIALTLELLERGWAVFESDHRVAEAVVQGTAFGAASASAKLAIHLACHLAFDAPTVGASALICPLIVGGLTVKVFKDYFEESLEHKVRQELVQP